MKHRMLLAILLLLQPGMASQARTEPLKLVIDRYEAAGIAGLRPLWDRPVVVSPQGLVRTEDKGEFGKGTLATWSESPRDGGREPAAMGFDAVHRSLLLRFPDAAERIAAELARGRVVASAHVILPWRDSELWTDHYEDSGGMSFVKDAWVKDPPRWHAVAYVLRKPWSSSDPALAPTFNAYIPGGGFWKRFGAQDPEHDRFPERLGPAEVSYAQPEGRLDITALLTDGRFGRDVFARLRVLSDQGLILRKLETYDARYFAGGYEFATATGGRMILIGAPRLEVTLMPGPVQDGTLPPAVDVPALARRLHHQPEGSPTATLPTEAQLAALAQQVGFGKPAWMPDWQWQRVQELNAAGGGWEFPREMASYELWIDQQLRHQPRLWTGFDAAQRLQMILSYREALPEPVIEHWKNYWRAWLNPDRAYDELLHPWTQSKEAIAWYREHQDWRGITSFYRTYSRSLGTQNFNHTAVAGALIGGALIDEPLPVVDGRFGFHDLILNTWGYRDGSTQESIDHYYFAISLKDQKLFADHGPIPADRLIGQAILAKNVEELTSHYHPGLRRFIAPSGRTGIAYLLGIHDGLANVVHTLSRSGAITDLGRPTADVAGMPTFGHDAPPGVIAEQALEGPWAPDHMSYYVDEKPLPYQITSAYTVWGNLDRSPIWRRAYLGRNYGLASQDVAIRNETVPVMAQWRRTDQQVRHASELGTLLVRYGINQTNLLDSLYHGTTSRNPNGSVGTFGSNTYTFQHNNKAIVLHSPLRGLRYPTTDPVAEVRSLQTTIGLMNFQDPPTWTLCLNGEAVKSLPIRAKAGDRITIRDGVTFLGFIPLPSTDLGRDVEVVITDQTGPQIELQGGGHARPALLIEQFNYRSQAAMSDERRHSDEVDHAYGGFVIEIADTTDFGSFEAFQRHLEDCSLEARYDPQTLTLHLDYRSGKDRLEAGMRTDYAGDWDRMIPTNELFTYRRVNGLWPYLSEAVYRDSTLTQLGKSGRLEKLDAVFITEPGLMAYLQAEPHTGTFAAYVPQPSGSTLELHMPGGRGIATRGRIGTTRITAQPKEGWVKIDYAPAELASSTSAVSPVDAFLLRGWEREPRVTINGHAVKPQSTAPENSVTWLVELSKDLEKPAPRPDAARILGPRQPAAPPTSAPRQADAPAPQPAWDGIVTSSGYDGDQQGPVMAFDNNPRTKWLANARDAWVQIELQEPRPLRAYTLLYGEDVPARDPLAWSLLASEDGKSWLTVDRQDLTDHPVPDRLSRARFPLRDDLSAFRFYRWQFDRNRGDVYIQIQDWLLELGE